MNQLRSKVYQALVPTKKVAFLHIGKCGGTSIRQILRPDNRDLKHMTKGAYVWQRINCLTWKYQIDWIEHSRVPQAIQTEESIACFIREPLERIESAFHSLFVMHKYYDLQPNAFQNKLISEFPSFHSFMNACLEQNHSLHSLAIDSFSSSGHDHFNKGYKYYFDSINSINNNKAKFVFIGLFEEFDEEAQRLFRTFRCPKSSSKKAQHSCSEKSHHT